MKNSRMKKAVVLCLAVLLLGGCGEAPYELTEAEESMIINYASHAVAKFNIKQKDGLTYVDLSELEETETEETEIAEEPETEVAEIPTEGGTTGGVAPDAQEPETVAQKTLQEVFGVEGVSINYAGYELAKSYMEADYYAMEASAGKVYLVVNIDLTNTSAGDVAVDILSQTPSLRVTADGAESTAEVTFLLNDFSTYQGTIPAGETVRTVLLFEVDETTESVAELSLNTTINGEKVSIIL